MMKFIRTFVIIFVFLDLVQTQSTFALIDNEDTVRTYFPRILNTTQVYLKTHVEFPDISDHIRKFEYLGLMNNVWSEFTLNYTTNTLKRFIMHPKNSTILVTFDSPALYEVKCDFIYNFLLLPLWGNVTIKGNITELQIHLKLKSTLEGLRAETLSISSSFILDSLKLNSYTFLIKFLKVEDIISRTFKNNIDVLVTSFNNAVSASAKEVFFRSYPGTEMWNFTMFRNHSQWNISNTFHKAFLTAAGELTVDYDTVDPVRLIYPLKARPNTKIRQFFLGMKTIKLVLDATYKNSGRIIEDSDLPAEIQDRLDMMSFEKLMPSAALKSITNYGLENNTVTLNVTPYSNLTYFLEQKEHQYILTTYIYNFTNKNEELVSGTVEVLFILTSIWHKEDYLGYFNIILEDVRLVGINTIPKVYNIIYNRFNRYLQQICNGIFSRFKGTGIIDKGIPIVDTIKSYENTEVYWNQIYNEIVINHY